MSKYPNYGADQVWTYVTLRGHVLPVVASDDQYCLRFPDGSQLWVEKWECETAFPSASPGFTIDRKALKERELERAERGGFRNRASSQFEIDRAFKRNEGKFQD
jgi:hypothetical protein